MKRKCGIWLLVGFLIFGVFSMAAVAEDSMPTDSFTHWDLANGTKKVVPMRDVYTVAAVLDARSIGLENGFEKITDIDCDKNGDLYLLTNDGRLICVGSDYKLLREYKIVDKNGEEVDYSGARGIYAPSADEIYIADTANNRVLCCDGSGVVIREIVQPESEILPEDFLFSPIRIEKDSKGYVYVLSDGAYYGALLFNPEGEFTGFYGANTVKGSALTTLSYLWDMLTKNDVKRANAVKVLPYQFLDLYVDENDFVYTCTGRTTSGVSTGQIKMLSPSGTSILYKEQWNGKRVAASGFNFGEAITEMRNNQAVVQDFIGIQVDENGYMYALDGTYGFIYVYDTNCNLITAFGGGKNNGEQKGVFSSAEAIAYSNGRVMVADSLLNTVTVFERTNYGDILLSAQKKTLDADYTGAKEEWREVLRQDTNSRLALHGLAKAAYSEGDYAAAQAYAQAGYDFVTYGQALEQTRGAFVQRNFIWIFLLTLAAIGALAAFMVITVKRKLVLIPNERVRLLFNGVVHPFDTFNAIKYQGKGSPIMATVMVLLFYVSAVVMEMGSNFRFTAFDPTTSSSVFLLLRTGGLVALWTVANWAVCVLLEGKGRLKDIFVVTGYSTLPLVVYNFLATILSHLITAPDSTILSGLSIVTLILAGIMLTIGLMVVHEFSFTKFLISVVLTLFAMLLIVFIIFMLGMLISQLWTFLATLFMESAYR